MQKAANALKNLLDHVPVEGLMGKACGVVAMGASDHHYLAIDTQIRPVLAWFSARWVAITALVSDSNPAIAPASDSCPDSKWLDLR